MKSVLFFRLLSVVSCGGGRPKYFLFLVLLCEIAIFSCFSKAVMLSSIRFDAGGRFHPVIFWYVCGIYSLLVSFWFARKRCFVLILYASFFRQSLILGCGVGLTIQYFRPRPRRSFVP